MNEIMNCTLPQFLAALRARAIIRRSELTLGTMVSQYGPGHVVFADYNLDCVDGCIADCDKIRPELYVDFLPVDYHAVKQYLFQMREIPSEMLNDENVMEVLSQIDRLPDCEVPDPIGGDNIPCFNNVAWLIDSPADERAHAEQCVQKVQEICGDIEVVGDCGFDALDVELRIERCGSWVVYGYESYATTPLVEARWVDGKAVVTNYTNPMALRPR